jgi:hypothetical protein
MEMAQSVRPVATTLPLRVLVMISAPIDVPQLDLVKERGRLEAALEPLHEKGKVHVTWQEDATLTALMRYLRKDQYHIFHFVGHGAFDDKRDVGLLLLEDEQERSFPVESDRIGAFLHDHSSLRLAVLNSCEGARSSRNDPFAGVAANLVRQGIPAVVAMQFEISDDAAITFSGEFYAALAEGLPVDAAVAEARKAIYATNDVEWATPVLYMRSESGLLFKLEEPDPTAKRDSTAQRRAALAARRESDQAALRAREAERQRERVRQSAGAAATRLTPGGRPGGPGKPPDNSLHKVFIFSGAIVLGLFALIVGIASLIGDRSGVKGVPPPPIEASYDISTLRANVQGLRLFESGEGYLAKDDRVYRTGFDPARTRFINVELELDHDGPIGGTLEATIPCTFYRADGSEVGTTPVLAQVQAGQTTTWPARGWGNKDGGSWVDGSYSVTCAFEGKNVGRATFVVKSAVAPRPPPPPPPRRPPRPPPPPPVAYDIPEIRARLKSIRFFESGYDPLPEDQRDYVRRFSRQATRYIWLQLDLNLPAPGKHMEVPLECKYYRAGQEYATLPPMMIRLEADWTDVWTRGGWGWAQVGNWPVGTYTAACRVEGVVFARGSFEVY